MKTEELQSLLDMGIQCPLLTRGATRQIIKRAIEQIESMEETIKEYKSELGEPTFKWEDIS